MTTPRPSILVVEDEADVRELLILHLSREGYQTTAVSDGEEALKLLDQNTYDLAVVDWMLPGLSGLELCKKTAHKISILMVTARSEPSDIILGLEMGADDYVTKPFDIPVFIARVKALIRRSEWKKSPSAAVRQLKIDALSLNRDTYAVTCGNVPLELTASEFKLLESLMLNQGKVLSRTRLIESIHGEGISVVDRAIDTHIFGLRKKMGKCADIVETIRGVGYRVKGI